VVVVVVVVVAVFVVVVVVVAVVVDLLFFDYYLDKIFKMLNLLVLSLILASVIQPTLAGKYTC